MVAMHNDIVIRGGTVVDGTGAPGTSADVAISGGRISEIGANLQGDRTLDASGQVVSPGFIDIHTHYDAQVFWDPKLTPSSFHGVTSVIAGNCGFSIAPIRAEGVSLLARTLQHVEDMSFDTLAAGVPWDEFETFPQYLDAVAARGTALNFGCYVGHTAVRLYVMGEDAYERPATEDEIALMQTVVADAMAGGAAGFASSASPTHNGDSGRPVPSRVADLAELRALLEPVKQCGRGVVALLPGGVFPNEEVFRLQREIGRPFTWTALLTVKGYPYHEKVIAEHDAAWADGVEVWPQVSCRPLVFQMNLSEPFTLNMRPDVRRADGQVQGRARRRLPRPVLAGDGVGGRQRQGRGLSRSTGRPFRWPSRARTPSWPTIRSPSWPRSAAARRSTSCSTSRSTTTSRRASGRCWPTTTPTPSPGCCPRDNVLLGLADSGAHVSQLCDACFSTDLLGNWVRDRGVMPLERAIHKLTGEPAGVYGLSDRGTVEVGQGGRPVCVRPGDGRPRAAAPGP